MVFLSNERRTITVTVEYAAYESSLSLRKRAYVIYRGYSNFLLNMAFISPSEVENIYIS